MRKEDDFESILNKETYHNILRLTIKFQDIEYNGKKGLLQRHYRYALIKNHGGITGVVAEKLKDFFGDELDILYKQNLIKKDIITSERNLTNKLTKLSSSKYQILKRFPDGKNKRYFISPEFAGKADKFDIETLIQCYPDDAVTRFEDHFSKKSKKIINNIQDESKLSIIAPTHTMGAIFGIPSDFSKLCNDNEKELLEKCLINIYKNIAELSNLKYIKTKAFVGYVNLSIFVQANVTEK